MGRPYSEEITIDEHLSCNPLAVVYPVRYGKKKHLQIDSHLHSELVKLSIWDNFVEDTRIPQDYICLSRDEAIAWLKTSLERLENDFNSRMVPHDIIVVKP